MKTFIEKLKNKFGSKSNDKKTFDTNLLIPKIGVIKSKIFENRFLKIPPTLFYEIQIYFEPFTLENEIIETSVQLNFIKLNKRKIKDIENTEFHFPINPEDGYIDGSIYLFNVHNPLDVTKIKFEKIVNNIVEVTLDYNIVFEFESTEYTNSMNNKMTTKLEIDKLYFDNELIGENNISINEINDFVSIFADIEDFIEPEIKENNISLKYKNCI